VPSLDKDINRKAVRSSAGEIWQRSPSLKRAAAICVPEMQRIRKGAFVSGRRKQLSKLAREVATGPTATSHFILSIFPVCGGCP